MNIAVGHLVMVLGTRKKLTTYSVQLAMARMLT